MSRKKAEKAVQRMTHIRLDESIRKRLRVRVAQADITIQDMVSALIGEYLGESTQRENSDQQFSSKTLKKR